MIEAALASQSRLNFIGRKLPIGSVDSSLDQSEWKVLVRGQSTTRPTFRKIKVEGGVTLVDPSSTGFSLNPNGPARRLEQFRRDFQVPPVLKCTERRWEKLEFIQRAIKVDSGNPSDIQSNVESVEEVQPTSEQS